jgi:hypothetical protein
MYALVGRVELKPGRQDEAAAMLREHGVAMVRSMPGSGAGYWARTMDEPNVIQHSFWLFETEEDARGAEATFNQLRSMPDAPATVVSVDVCEVVGQT